MTFAVLKFVGINPESFIVLNRIFKGMITVSSASLKTDILTPSGPAAEFLLDDLIASLISSFNISISFMLPYAAVKNPFGQLGSPLFFLSFQKPALMEAAWTLSLVCWSLYVIAIGKPV